MGLCFFFLWPICLCAKICCCLRTGAGSCFFFVNFFCFCCLFFLELELNNSIFRDGSLGNFVLLIFLISQLNQF